MTIANKLKVETDITVYLKKPLDNCYSSAKMHSGFFPVNVIRDPKVASKAIARKIKRN